MTKIEEMKTTLEKIGFKEGQGVQLTENGDKYLVYRVKTDKATNVEGVNVLPLVVTEKANGAMYEFSVHDIARASDMHDNVFKTLTSLNSFLKPVSVAIHNMVDKDKSFIDFSYTVTLLNGDNEYTESQLANGIHLLFDAVNNTSEVVVAASKESPEVSTFMDVVGEYRKNNTQLTTQ